MKIDQMGTIIKKKIVDFLEDHSDEVYSARELAKQFNLSADAAASPKSIKRMLGGKYVINDTVSGKVYFGCTKAIKKYKQLAGITDDEN